MAISTRRKLQPIAIGAGVGVGAAALLVAATNSWDSWKVWVVVGVPAAAAGATLGILFMPLPEGWP